MKILMICTVEFSKNGIAMCILNYCKYMCKDIEIDLVVPNALSGDMISLLNQENINYYVIERKKQPLHYFWKIERLVKKNKYDIVHAHGNSATLEIEMLAAKLGGCKHRIAHSHNTTCNHIFIHKFLRFFFLKDCSLGLACGEKAGKWLFGKKEFSVANNGIEISKFQYSEDIRSQLRKKYDLEDKIVLGHVGVFNYQKNQEFLVELVKKLRGKGKKCCLLLIGEGSNKEKIEQMVKKEDLENDVRFIGNSTRVHDWLQVFDVFILPSRFEGLPYVLIEAQASGLRCFVSDQVSKEVAVTNLIDFYSLERMSEWEKAIDNVKKYDRKKLSDQAIDLLKKSGFDISENAKWLEKIYQDLMQGEKR